MVESTYRYSDSQAKGQSHGKYGQSLQSTACALVRVPLGFPPYHDGPRSKPLRATDTHEQNRHTVKKVPGECRVALTADTPQWWHKPTQVRIGEAFPFPGWAYCRYAIQGCDRLLGIGPPAALDTQCRQQQGKQHKEQTVGDRDRNNALGV